MKPVSRSRYYKSYYPFGTLSQLATIHGDALYKREFALEGSYYKRYVEAVDIRELHTTAETVPELSSIHIGPVCTEAVSLCRKGLSVPVRRELIFDIDLTDYDFLDLHTNDEKGIEEIDIAACDRAWGFAAFGVFMLRYMLREQFGYEEFMIVYSGRRGVHLWVLDERAMGLTDEMRSAVAMFVNLDLDSGRVATMDMLRMVDSYDLWEVVEEAFLDLVVRSDHFDSFANLANFVERLDLKLEGLRDLTRDAYVKATPEETWKYIHIKVLAAAALIRSPKQSRSKKGHAPHDDQMEKDGVHDNMEKDSWVYDRLRRTMLAYVWPRIDLNVTRAVNHLIKAPFVAHPKTGRIAIPLDPSDYWRFDPSSAPSLNDLGTPEQWAARCIDITRWIIRDRPTLPCSVARRVVRRSRPVGVVGMDIEDMGMSAVASL